MLLLFCPKINPVAGGVGLVACHSSRRHRPKARGMSDMTRNIEVTQEALYKALSEKGDPRMSTLFGVIKALGLKVKLVPEGA